MLSKIVVTNNEFEAESKKAFRSMERNHRLHTLLELEDDPGACLIITRTTYAFASGFSVKAFEGLVMKFKLKQRMEFHERKTKK